LVEYASKIKLKRSAQIVTLVVIISALFLGSYYTGLTREFCGKDQVCFEEKAATCSPAEVYISRENNVYSYVMHPTLRNKCQITITFERAQEGTAQEHVEFLEGKEMTCIIPKGDMRSLDVIQMDQVMEYCHGPLKEGLYELIVKRMYEVVVANLGSIVEEVERVMKV